ncbi:MAG: hypothetical protein ACHREM_07145 [Polyangiales bacterium]
MSNKNTPSSSKPNDDRSKVLNPNNPAHGAATDNRANQMNPMHPEHSGGGSGASTPKPK